MATVAVVLGAVVELVFVVLGVKVVDEVVVVLAATVVEKYLQSTSGQRKRSLPMGMLTSKNTCTRSKNDMHFFFLVWRRLFTCFFR